LSVATVVLVVVLPLLAVGTVQEIIAKIEAYKAGGASKFVLLPIALNRLPEAFGLTLPTTTASYLELMIFGALIVFFLIVEPHGLARLWSTGKEKLRLWPFPH